MRIRRATPCILALGILCATVLAADAACDQPGDPDLVAAVRADVDAQCDCAAAASHLEYVRCVTRVARLAVRGGQLPARCKPQVVRCGIRSTCGRPGFAVCCRQDANGTRRCGVREAARCVAPSGGVACLGSGRSCCDGCGCVPASTTTTSTTLPVACKGDGDCDDGNGCSADRCVDGKCTHECLCVGPGGGFTCCPGPVAQCGGSLVWWYTCGDPVCGGHRDHPGVPPCTPAETAEPHAPCAPEGAECDPGSDCNQLLVCATSDPQRGGQCPISRRRFKEGVQYLSRAELRELRDQLVHFPLATFRYRGAPASRTQLGFVIEDVEPSLSIDAGHDMVDLYGYATMAVAAIQVQAREIEALRREVAELRATVEGQRRAN